VLTVYSIISEAAFSRLASRVNGKASSTTAPEIRGTNQ